MKINRVWAMPNKNTFSIKPINDLISELFVKVCMIKGSVVDPFCNNSPFKRKCYSNDIDPAIEADSHADALDFLKSIKDSSCKLVLFDPPYSPRQVSECYKKHGKTVNMETTQASFWSNLKKEIQRITMDKGIVVSCGWNSGGIGESYGFVMEEILLVPHGGAHNDTIVTVEKKLIPVQEVANI